MNKEHQDFPPNSHMTDANSLYKGTSDGGLIGSWEHDMITHRDHWSENIFNMLELPRDIQPDYKMILTFCNEPYRTMLKKAMLSACLDGSSWDLTLELTTNNEKTIWVRLQGEAVVEAEQIIKLKGVLMDVDQYRENAASLQLLKQRNKHLRGFTHILSHNLRNHANNIAFLTGFIEMDTLDEDNRDLVIKLKEVSAQLSETIQHLSESVKINENFIEASEIDMETCAMKVLSLLETEINLHQATIEIDFTVRRIIFPAPYFESILTNLISNSIKYSKANEHAHVLISTYWDDLTKHTVLEYQDNGIGIDLDRHGDQLFGLYKTFSDHPDAHGVGLFLVKTQVESQGGFILVESKPGVGTIFRIFFKANA
jgi:signal transduction histidine kinase